MANLASLAMVSSLFSYFCVSLLRVAHYYQNSGSGRNAAVRGRRGTGGSGRAVLVACLWLAAGLGVFSVSLRVSDSAERAAGRERFRFTEPPPSRAEPAGPRVS